ncbi:MAG: polymer-forming cytoskeletal protein [Formosimonas sp.]|jgi:cytoskeletal protein CcmA (bactofilin family)
MFGNKKDENGTVNHTITTFIGESASFEGNLTAQASIKVDGRINGDMNIEGMIVLGETARITGNVNTTELIVYGHIDGNVNATTLTLKSSGHITGNIHVKNLEIESGASYQGHVQMQSTTSTTI